MSVSFFPFHHVGPGEQTQVMRLGSERHSPWNHVTSLLTPHFECYWPSSSPFPISDRKSALKITRLQLLSSAAS